MNFSNTKKNYRIYTNLHPSGKVLGGTSIIIKEFFKKHFECEKHSEPHMQQVFALTMETKISQIRLFICYPKETQTKLNSLIFSES